MFWRKQVSTPPKEEDACELWKFAPQPDITAYELATIISSIHPGTGGYRGPIKTPAGDKSPEGHMGHAAGRHYVRMEGAPC